MQPITYSQRLEATREAIKKFDIDRVADMSGLTAPALTQFKKGAALSSQDLDALDEALRLLRCEVSHV
jgi:RNA polymerase-interacting CarD/CdnL/TRCF family regulator